MNKRFISLLLVLLIALGGFPAFAEEAASSVTVETIVTVTGAVSSTGVTLPETFQVAIAPQSETAAKVVTEMAEVIKTAPITSYFATETVNAIAAKLPDEVAVESLKLAEVSTLTVAEYDASYADVVVSMATSVKYADNTPVIVMVGVVVDGVITWVPMDAVVLNGQINITFTQDVLAAAATNELIFALLTAE